MDDDLLKGALGLDSDDDAAALPFEPPAETDPATQRLQEAGLDSDEDDKAGVQPIQYDEQVKEESPVLGSPGADAGELKGVWSSPSIVLQWHVYSSKGTTVLVHKVCHPMQTYCA
jgi:hypothetical protein